MLRGNIVCIICLFSLLAGCAHYNPASLASLPPEYLPKQAIESDVVIAAKAFSKADCKHYLDRDVLSKGYQPIQIYIENQSEKTFRFSTQRVHLPLVPPEEVAEKMHTSTWGRVIGYSATAVVATPIFLIPAVVDGLKSSHANEALDADFQTKSARDQLILPFSHTNMLIFVALKDYQDRFVMTLLDEESRQTKRFIVQVK